MTRTTVNGRRVLITGATSGIGLATAQALAAAGAVVTLHARTDRQASAALDAIKTAVPAAKITGVAADLSTRQGVQQLIDSVRSEPVDVLINNAGAAFQEHGLTADGFEQTFAINHLAVAQLIDGLLPTIGNSSDGRIINVSSSLERRGVIAPGDANPAVGYRSLQAYANSKLWNLLYSRALAQRLHGTSTTIGIADPGAVATAFGAKAGGVLRLMMTVGRPFMSSPTKGSTSTLLLATSPAPHPTGTFVSKGRVADSSAQSNDPALITSSWKTTRTLLGLPPELPLNEGTHQ